MGWASLLPSVIEIAAGAFLGVIAGWKISAHYAKQSSQELREEAERLRRQTELLMRGVEEMAKSGNFEWNRNEQDDLIGISFKRTVGD